LNEFNSSQAVVLEHFKARGGAQYRELCTTCSENNTGLKAQLKYVTGCGT
jgi:hypothetical protein